MDQEMLSRVNLLVGIDQRSYNTVRSTLNSLFKDRQKLSLDDSSIQKFAGQFKEMIAEVGQDLDAATTKALDASLGEMLAKFAGFREEMVAAAAAGNDERLEQLLLEEQALVTKINAETQMVQDRVKAERKSREEAKKAEVETAKKREEAAKELKNALKLSPENFKKGAEAMSSGFLDAVNKAKSGDLSGLGESMASAVASGLGKASETAAMGSKAADTAGMAKSLGLLSTGLSAAAVSVAALAAAFVAVTAVLVMADQQTRDLNKTMLEGASMADMAYQGVGRSVGDVTKTMDASRKAAIDMATKYRGSADEFAGIIGQLNQAGLSYGEMTKMAGKHRNETQAIAKATETAFIWSQALGISTSESAEAMATWSSQFGADLDKISEQFASIAGFAQEGGFNVKRFFSAVSQATAGMQLYNVRMEEAAYLLSKTSKILGDTDASDFIRSLTQGFTDESMVDRMKRVMIAGGEDTARIFDATAQRTAKGFVSTFQGTVTGDKLRTAFEKTGVEFDAKILSDPAMLKKTWGDIDDKSRRLIIGRLRENNDEQSSAMARQLETFGRLTDAVDGGFSEQVRGLGALDMQGKLAFKLQTLGDKRLNEMGAVELAAFEQYAGISGSQLEQLMRVESQLMADYDLAKAEGRTTAASFQEWVATNEDAQKQMEEVKDIEDEAKYFTRQSVENTRSMFAWMQNTLASILNDIYGILVSIFGSSKELSQESVKKQTEALGEIRGQKDAATKGLEELDAQLAEVDKTLATTGKDSEAHQEALAEKARLEADARSKSAAKDLLGAQERMVLSMDDSTLSDFTSGADVIGEAAKELAASGEDLDIVAEHLNPEEMARVMDARAEAARSDPEYKRFKDMATVAGGAPTLGWGGVAASTLGASAVTEYATGGYVAGPMQAAAGTLDTQQAAKGAATLSALLSGTSGETRELTQEEMAKALGMPVEEIAETQVALSEEQLAEATRTATQLESVKDTALKEKRAREKWEKAGYAKETQDAMVKALQAVELSKLATAMGVDPGQLQADIDAGLNAATLQAKYGDRASKLPPELAAIATGYGLKPQAQDFVMRPGQPAQRFSSSDTLVGFKPGGPIAGAGGGGTVNITINGGDQAKVYQTVKDALKNSGLR